MKFGRKKNEMSKFWLQEVGINQHNISFDSKIV